MQKSDTVFVSGEITSDTIKEIKTAINAQTFGIDLDLSDTTGLTSIENAAFYLCAGLTNIEMPNSVIAIGFNAFRWCKNLTNIKIPSNVTSIGSSAFYGCTGLTSIEIPRVADLASTVFCDCTNLTSMTFLGTVSEWNNITKGENWNKNVPATEVVCSDGVVPLK